MKEVEENTKKWKDILCSLIGRTNIAKMFIIPKQSTDLMQFLSEYLTFFTELEQIILQFILKPQKTTSRQSNHKQKEQSRKYHAP